jgi:hypothetical protein
MSAHCSVIEEVSPLPPRSLPSFEHNSDVTERRTHGQSELTFSTVPPPRAAAASLYLDDPHQGDDGLGNDDVNLAMRDASAVGAVATRDAEYA